MKIESHEVHKYKWKINYSYFEKASISYEPYHSYDEAKDLMAKDRAFRGTISFMNGINSTGVIKSEDFVKNVFARGGSINRATHECDVIFCPIGDNWEQHLVINQTEDIKNIKEIEEAERHSEELLHYNEYKRRGNKNFSEEKVNPEIQS